MDIDKIINIIREQRFGVPPGAALGGGGGGTNALTSQAKARTIRSMLTDPTGSKLRKQQHNDPQNYLTDADYRNRNKNLPAKKEREPYKEEMSMGPTNAVGAPPGNIAGIHGDPPVRRPWNKGKKYLKGPGRKTWMV